jgi:hypothetical protein
MEPAMQIQKALASATILMCSLLTIIPVDALTISPTYSIRFAMDALALVMALE